MQRGGWVRAKNVVGSGNKMVLSLGFCRRGFFGVFSVVVCGGFSFFCHCEVFH